MNLSRSSGVFLHLTSLPGAHGIGTLGRPAMEFIDFLAAAGQRYWQILPLGPTDQIFDNSPYMSTSAFAGNPLLIDPEPLKEAGWLQEADLAGRPKFSEYRVDFERLIPFQWKLLHTAFANFRQATNDGKDLPAFLTFCKKSASWLNDYALFMSLSEENNFTAWHTWDRPVAERKPAALTASRKRLAEPILFRQFIQFCFAEQWQRLRDHAASRGIALMGDLPIYMGHDSVDVWAHQDIFKLDAETLLPSAVAGVPPDYFSATGQRWGNPLYRWRTPSGRINEPLHDWWLARFKHLFKQLDLVRIDHFRGFESFWQIPAEEETAVNGRWIKGPGKSFFSKLEKKLGPLPIVAEDLGLITPAVAKLRQDLGFPGMKVLQFAFDNDPHNQYLPHNYADNNCVVYTGTHDNNTTLGWFLGETADEATRKTIQRYVHTCDDAEIHWDLIRLAFSSIARLAIVPMQDVLGFGEDCRLNTPGTSRGNWRWRCAPRFLTQKLAERLRAVTELYNRAGTAN